MTSACGRRGKGGADRERLRREPLIHPEIGEIVERSSSEEAHLPVLERTQLAEKIGCSPSSRMFINVHLAGWKPPTRDHLRRACLQGGPGIEAANRRVLSTPTPRLQETDATSWPSCSKTSRNHGRGFMVSPAYATRPSRPRYPDGAASNFMQRDEIHATFRLARSYWARSSW